jgi:hypothetical protein
MGRTIITENDVREAYLRSEMAIKDQVEMARKDQAQTALQAGDRILTAATEPSSPRSRRGWWLKLTGRLRAGEERRAQIEELRAQIVELIAVQRAQAAREIAQLEEQRKEEARATLSEKVDGYTDRLLKYIPAESVALYLTLQGIVLSSVEAQALTTWLWFAFVIGCIGTPLYLWRIQQVSKRIQLAVSTAAFGVWVFALGGAFASLSLYEPFLGSVVLVIFTFFVPLISPDVLRSEEAA